MIVLQDVFGGADTKYLAAQSTDRKKRDAGKRTLSFRRKLLTSTFAFQLAYT
jgi:hypothetical protein